MKKILLLVGVMVMVINLFGQNSPTWSWPQCRNFDGAENPEQPATIYLGDKGFFGHDSWGQVDGHDGQWRVVIKTSSNLSDGGIYGDLTSTSNTEHKTAWSPRFTQVGTWYWGMQVIYPDAGNTTAWYCKDITDWENMYATPTSDLTITVSALSNPSSSSASASSSSTIALSWTKWNSKNVMVLRKLSSDSWTEPTQGTAYSVGNTIGSGTVTVVYNSDGTNFTDSDLLPNTSYDYKFYSENWSYYSDGAISANISTDNTSATDHFRSKTTGNWNSAGTWESSPDNSNWVTSTLIPGASATSITIISGHNITLNDDISVPSLTINNGATFTASDGSKANRTLTISDGGTLTNNGTFDKADGKVVFAGAGTVAGDNSTTFNDLELNGVLTATTAPVIDGTLTLNSGGSISTNSPSFGTDATLVYNQGGDLAPSLEWPDSNSPTNIEIKNSTNLSLTSSKSISGNLTVTKGSLKSTGSNTLTMNGNNQVITISNTSGGAIYGTDNGYGNDLSLVISDGSTTTLTGDETTNNDDEKKFYNISVNSGGTLALSRGILCKYGTFTVNGTLQINANGYVQSSAGGNAKAASYSSGTLVYNTAGSDTSKDYEWPTTNAPTNLIIQNSGTNVTLNNAKSITGNVTIETGTTLTSSGNLTLLSDASGTASLISNGTVTGDVTVERHLTPYYNDTDGKYHFISSPVSAQKIQDEMDGGEVSVENFVTDPPAATTDFYKFDETTNEWVNSKLEDINEDLIWNDDFEDNFSVGRGYLVAYKTDAVTKNFTGTLNNDASYVITCTHTADGAEGWNLIGNPYPAAIDWDAVTLGDGMDNALYYYDSDKSNYRYYIQLAGEIGAESGGSRYIPAMQGFMVHAKSTGTKTVTIEKSDLTHADQAFYKSGNASNGIDGSMKIEIQSGDLTDETFIHFQSDATMEFDGNYDAYKLFGFNTEVPNIYTVNDQGTKFAINGLPASRENELSIPLYLKPGVDGLFSLKPIINDLNTAITLEDLGTNNFVDLKAVEAYEFVASADDDPNRFILHFGTLTDIEDQIKTPKVFAYINGDNLHIRNMEGDYTLRLNDISGRNIMQQQINGNAEVALPSDLNAGVYLLEITSGSNRTVEKVVLN